MLRNSKNLVFQKDSTLRFLVSAYLSQNIVWRWNSLTDLWRHFFWYSFKTTVEVCKPQISGFHLCLRESRSSYHPSRQQRSDLTSVFALFVWTESACGHCGLTWLELLREHNVSQLYGFLGLIFSSWSINPAADPALDILMESIKGYITSFFVFCQACFVFASKRKRTSGISGIVND